MADDAPTGETSIGATLKGKMGPLPLYAWVLMGIAVLAYYMYHRRQSAPKSATAVAAGQTATDLGSASQLANMFQVAGLMPYQGGSVYVNTTTDNKPPSSATPGVSRETEIVNVTRGESVGQLVSDMQKYVPGFSWADFWALNPNIVAQGKLLHQSNNDWRFSAEATPVVVTKKGQVSNPFTTRTFGPIPSGR